MMNLSRLGVMLDCSRNAVLKPEKIKEFIDIIAQIGYNTLELYMEDTYKIEGEPYFGYLRGGYTAEELKDFDSYAATKGIEVIPAIQTLAHLVDVLKWRVFDDIRENDVCLLVDEEKTYAFVRDLLVEATRPFRSKRVHIGMDEAYNLGRGAFLDKQDRKSVV